MTDPTLPVGTELRTAHGTSWVKVGPNLWRARGRWGVLDVATSYSDRDVHGEQVPNLDGTYLADSDGGDCASSDEPDVSLSPGRRIAALCALSGLTPDQVGRLFGVSRRSVHNWIDGNAMAPQHEQRAAELLALVQVIPGSTSDERRAALLDSSQGASLFCQLAAANDEGARLQVSAVSVRERIQL